MYIHKGDCSVTVTLCSWSDFNFKDMPSFKNQFEKMPVEAFVGFVFIFSVEQFVEPRAPHLMFGKKRKNLLIISRPNTYFQKIFEDIFFPFYSILSLTFFFFTNWHDSGLLICFFPENYSFPLNRNNISG